MVWKNINGLDRVSDGQECHWGARGVPPVKHLHTILTSVALSFHRVCDKDSDERRNLWSTVFVPMILSRAGVSCFYHLVRVGDGQECATGVRHLSCHQSDTSTLGWFG